MTTYKGCLLHKNSLAYQLYREWQKDTSDAKLKQKLDQHMKEVDVRYRELLK